MNDLICGKIEGSSVVAKAHKLIFKLTENISNLIEDVNQDNEKGGILKVEGAAQVM